jgi:hypothetical protein
MRELYFEKFISFAAWLFMAEIPSQFTILIRNKNKLFLNKNVMLTLLIKGNQ